MKIRRPCQAGSFYAATPEALKTQLQKCYTHEFGPGHPSITQKGPRKVVGLVCPHAGYMYSGPVAAHSYFKVALDGRPDVFVILGPNHAGQGSGLSIMREGIWRTPLGDVQIDSEIADLILHESSIIDADFMGHAYEHSIEVQLPFLQHLFGSAFKLVPISFLMQDFESSSEAGHAISKALHNKNAVIIASTDMTHYEPRDTAERKDRMALSALERLDEKQFYSTIEAQRITACGYGPTVALITAAKLLGATKGEILCYKTSGDITRDHSSVVGYASVAISR